MFKLIAFLDVEAPNKIIYMLCYSDRKIQRIKGNDDRK